MFWVPVALRELVITGVGGGGAVVIVKVGIADPVPPLFVALTVTLKVPETVGAPEIMPVLVLIDRPVGKPLAPKLVGLLVAVI